MAARSWGWVRTSEQAVSFCLKGEYRDQLPGHPGNHGAELGGKPGCGRGKPRTLRELKQAVAAKPQDPQAHYSLGLKYESLGKTKKALEEYRKSLSLKPGDVKVLYSLGRLMAALGEPDQAIGIIKQAVKLNPKSAEARSLLAAVYNQQAMAFMQQGNLDAARQSLEAGIQAKGGPAGPRPSAIIWDAFMSGRTNWTRRSEPCRRYSAKIRTFPWRITTWPSFITPRGTTSWPRSNFSL